MKKSFLAATAAIVFAVTSGHSVVSHAADVQVGTLSCRVAGGVGLIIGSSKGMNCVFKHAGGHTEHYSGSIDKLGVDIGFTNETRIIWTVLAPSVDVPSGALAGRYGGATAEATAGVGVGANVLVGGLSNSFTLQPVSVQGQTGLNVAGGLARVTLRAK